MGATAKILYSVFRAAKGLLGIDHPIDLFQWIEITVKVVGQPERFEGREKLQFPFLEGNPQHAGKHAAAGDEPDSWVTAGYHFDVGPQRLSL